jgi:hypothetical protein
MKKIETLLQLNSFPKSDNPLIVVVRNTDIDGMYVPDTGDNLCDLVIVGGMMMKGRSYPHIKYLKEQAAGRAQCNFIASGYYRDAWEPGWHFSHRALVQRKITPFMIWRSTDTTLGNSDDYTQYSHVWDNFHGFAPDSAGCVTVGGMMTPATGDWARCYDWIFRTHSKAVSFDLAIFTHKDWQQPRKAIRFGSVGEDVKSLQVGLVGAGYKVMPDGIFGPGTFDAVRAYQRKAGFMDTGIVYEHEWRIAC